MSATVNPDELVGVAEIADAAGVTRGRVSQWAAAGTLGFPAPVAHLAAGPVWCWPAVAAWLAETNRPRPDGTPVPNPSGPYDRLAVELEEVAAYIATGLTPKDACQAVAQARHLDHAIPVRTMAARLRHLYPGWKARQRTA